MSWLLDTNVISQMARRGGDPRVVAWIEQQRQHELFLSVITLGEIQRGATRLPAGNRKTQILEWLHGDLPARFGGRILPVESNVALRWGELTGLERMLPVDDALIAATALVHGLTVATRNVVHFATTGARVFNPWESSP